MGEGRKSLVDVVVDDVLDRILRGDIEPHSMLPTEVDIAREVRVSRLTVREAMKVLKSQNIVETRRGLGTFANPPRSWTGLEAVMRVASQKSDSGQIALRLLEVRRMVEVGAAELAASHRSREDLDAMGVAIQQMEAAHRVADVDALTSADIAFHDTILHASANPFVPALLGQLSPLLVAARRETSAFPQVQEHAIRHHKLIRDAIASAAPDKARKTMEEHINQTYADYQRFISPAR
ncbi:MAG: FadR family transcriptional regulator [Nocardiopsaceae bacterium]|nr:FadR family transcriptional regulator [Nocardiopsaceae bacterium]